MKWPAAVEKSLVKDKRINDMAASLFNAVDYAKVKGDLTQFKHICPTDTALAFSETINKVGAQSQKTTPGSGDREDPVSTFLNTSTYRLLINCTSDHLL